MRPVFLPRDFSSRPLGLLAASAALALLLSVLFFAASYGSLGRGGQDRVTDGFAMGALTDNLNGDHVTGRHQYNDCLILGLALEQNAPLLELAISPMHPFGRSERVCQDLRTKIFAADKQYYHNYLHGHTVLVRYLLPHMPVQLIRELYKGVASVLLLTGIGLCLLRLMRRESMGESLILLIVLLGLGRFFGLDWFGQSLSHGPADMALIAFVLSAVTLTGRLGVLGWVLLTSVFGVLTIVFEFLTGGLPLGAAAVLGLGWFVLSPAARKPKNVLLGLGSFATAVAMVITAKLILVAWVFGIDAVLALATAGGARMNGPLPEHFADRKALEQIIQSLGVLAPGLPLLAAGLLLMSFGAGVASSLRRPEPPALFLLASCLPIFGWFLLFQQHTAIHAWFMARILVWPLIAGFALVAWRLVCEPRESRAALPDSSAGRLPSPL